MRRAIVLTPAFVNLICCHPAGSDTEKPYLAMTTLVLLVGAAADDVPSEAQATMAELLTAIIHFLELGSRIRSPSSKQPPRLRRSCRSERRLCDCRSSFNPDLSGPFNVHEGPSVHVRRPGTASDVRAARKADRAEHLDDCC